MGSRIPILLIAYVFPPYYGIGGRRWAKHANELTKLGYTVHVVCARNPYDKQSLWTDLIKNNKDIILHVLPTRFPDVVVTFGDGFIKKLQYRIWVIILRLLCRGSFYDRSIFWKRLLLKESANLIVKHNIEKVICTGAPFAAMYYATLLKKKFRNLYLVNDLRDPWTWGSVWGFEHLSKRRMNYEKKMEYLTIEGSDLITVPDIKMMNYLRENYRQFEKKIVEIPHSFDPEELSVFEKTKSTKIRLVYYGTIYDYIENFLEKTAEFLARHSDKFSLDIYTDSKKHEPYFLKYKSDNVRTFPQENAKTLFQKFADYDYVFIMTTDYAKDYISTKFFEIIYTHTPIIIFSNPGRAGEFMENNGLGLHVDLNTFEMKMLELYESEFPLNKNFDISKYSLKTVAHDIHEILTKSYKS